MKTPPLKRLVIVAAALAVVAAALYLPAARFDFIDYDEREFVVQNPRIREGLTVDGIRWAFTTPYAIHYIPFTWLSFMADVSLHGMDPRGFHLVNAALHATNTALLFAALLGLTGAIWPSVLTAALFAVHPLNVESVAWIYERKGLLSAFFCLWALLAYVRYVRRPSAGRYLAAAACLLAALLSKPAAISLPAALLILDWWPLGRLAGRPGEMRAPTLRRLVPLVVEKVPLLLLSGSFGVILLLIFRKGEHLSSAISLGSQAANSLVSYLLYLWKAVWPSRLSVAYLIADGAHPRWLVLLAAAALVGVTLAVAAAARRLPYLAAGWLWYLVVMFPMIGLLNVGFQAMADRYAYLPLVGIFLGAVWWAAEAARGSGVVRVAVLAAAAISLSALGVRTELQLPYWRNSITLFKRAIELDPNSSIAWDGLGGTYLRLGRFPEAVEAYHKALDVNPGLIDTWYNLGLIYLRIRSPREAADALQRAVALNPRDIQARSQRLLALSLLGDREAVRREYEELRALDPAAAEALRTRLP